MPSQVTSSSSSSPDARGSRRSWLLPAGTFVAGCVLGAVVMGVGDVGGDDEPSTASDPVAAADGGSEEGGAAGDETTDPGAEDSGLYVRVPESCVRTADDATTLVDQVDRIVGAVAELEPERLRQTVDEVQQVRNQVRDVAEQCRVAAAERLEDVADAEADGPEADDTAPATPGS